MLLIMLFLFVYTLLLLDGTVFDIRVAVIVCPLGVIAWTKFLESFGNSRGLPFERVFWVIPAGCLMMQIGNFVTFIFGGEVDLRYHAYVVGALILVGVYIYQYTGYQYIGRRSAAARWNTADVT